jgi:uncharacterized protein YndB with AHSA1/START domain
MNGDATVETTGGRHVLRYERRLAHAPGRVWRALTEPSELEAWLAAAEVDLREGGALVLRWLNTDDEGRQAVMEARITELDVGRVLEFDGEPHGRLRWELAPDGDGTLLTFTVTLPAPNPQLALALAGWHIHLEHLQAALGGDRVDWPAWDREHRPRWQVHHDRYAARA